MTGLFLLGTDGFWGITTGFKCSGMNLEVLKSGIHLAGFPSDAFNLLILDLHPRSVLSRMKLG